VPIDATTAPAAAEITHLATEFKSRSRMIASFVLGNRPRSGYLLFAYLADRGRKSGSPTSV
jgi:hypothetical protein